PVRARRLWILPLPVRRQRRCASDAPGPHRQVSAALRTPLREAHGGLVCPRSYFALAGNQRHGVDLLF
ncbi:MAG TPA: hypothetical protein VK988_04730, partial [Acidimicrobiales bacterium]|nr:hypothetical protein [Acidimicrobiales bacterium]